MLHVLIMAGGSGTRFWPRSRRTRPKQLLRLFGDRSMIQQTLDRLGTLASPERVLVVTGQDQAAAIHEQLPELAASSIIAEPCPRDTAACVGLAALKVAAAEPDATMLVLSADHRIAPDTAFQESVRAAVEEVEADPRCFVVFGVVPGWPETGYGYIESGRLLPSRRGVVLNEVARFKEKPARAQAEEFVQAGNFLWNAGMFVWKARAVLDALARHQPQIAEKLEELRPSVGTPREAAELARIFPNIPRMPIDKAVMEPAAAAGCVKVVEVRYEWSDVGDWRSLAELLDHDPDGNVAQGSVFLQDTRNSIVINDEGGLVATLGLEDVVVVQSGGATLVARKDRLDDLKKLVAGIEATGHGNLL